MHTGSAKSYACFVRSWWRYEMGKRVPYPGAPRSYKARGMTYDEARAFCDQWNSTHDPGPLSRKCEFEEE